MSEAEFSRGKLLPFQRFPQFLLMLFEPWREESRSRQELSLLRDDSIGLSLLRDDSIGLSLLRDDPIGLPLLRDDSIGLSLLRDDTIWLHARRRALGHRSASPPFRPRAQSGRG